jgi:hypothetical protein
VGCRRHKLAAAPPIRIASILALIGFLGFVGFARAEDVSPFLNLDAGACDKLEDKNLQVGPPDADIVAACAALHRGAVLGVPLRSVAGLMGRASGRSTALLSLEAPLAFVLRGCVGLVILAILSVPYAIAGGCIVMLAAAILSLRKARAARSQDETAPAPSRASVALADVINDVYASAAGILGIALLSRRDLWWLAFGIALALVASIPAVIAARRRLRSEPMARLAATAALGALFGAAAIADPDVATRFGDAATPALASALIFALAVLAAGWRTWTNRRSPAPAGS